jgi:hypothetical protein
MGVRSKQRDQTQHIETRQMSYNEYYMARSVSADVGFGKKVWMLKLPREASSAANGADLLGSVVEEGGRGWGFLEVNYPIPYHMSATQLVLNRLKAEAAALGLDPNKLVDQQKIAGATITLTKSNGLDLKVISSFPGLPVQLELTVDLESTSRVTISFGPGSRIEYVPTEHLARLAKKLNYDSSKIDPNVAIDISDNLIVDQIVVAKDYTLEFALNKKLDVGFDAEARASNADIGAKFAVRKTSATAFKVAVKDGVDYLVGLKTIDWDDL